MPKIRSLMDATGMKFPEAVEHLASNMRMGCKDFQKSGHPGDPDISVHYSLFQNWHWAIFEDGMQHRNESYWIDSERLLETTEGYGVGVVYDWLPHLAEKPWIDLRQFWQAWRMALVLFDKDMLLDREMALRSYEIAKKIKKRLQSDVG